MFPFVLFWSRRRVTAVFVYMASPREFLGTARADHQHDVSVPQVLDGGAGTLGASFTVEAIPSAGSAAVEGYPDFGLGLAVNFLLRDAHQILSPRIDGSLSGRLV